MPEVALASSRRTGIVPASVSAGIIAALNCHEARRGQVPHATSGLMNTFERVVVINLARRPDRLARFSMRMEGNWPFAAPRRFEAIDGVGMPLPATWTHGPGAWGCLQSHCAVLDAAIADGVSSLLVLEDDAYLADDLPRQAELFLARVPTDWNCLMFGAEHLMPPVSVGPGVFRCTVSIRCHAYAVRGPLMRMLSAFWRRNQADHCDLVLSSLMGHYKVYAPNPPLIGQDAGLSDITPRQFPLRFLTSGEPSQIVVNPRIRKMVTKAEWLARRGANQGRDARDMSGTTIGEE
jgi:hypothetical protein